MSCVALDNLLKAVCALHLATPDVHGFGDWPGDLAPRDVPPAMLPVAEVVASLTAAGRPAWAGLFGALTAAVPHLHWKQTYSEAEVGADFLARYGYAELFGPQGHFHSGTLRGFIGYWGPGLKYDWHHHAAAELYFVLSGGAEFRSEGMETAYLRPGQSRRHTPDQPHAIALRDEHLLVYALWRGQGVADNARLGRA